MSDDTDRSTTDTPDLQRAVLAMRDAPQPGWIDLSQSIREAIRASVRRGVELPADPGPDARPDSKLHVSDAVLKLRIRDAVKTENRALAGVGFRLEDDRLARVVLDLVCRYGTDFVAEASQARTATGAVLCEVLGSLGDVGVDVKVVDIM